MRQFLLPAILIILRTEIVFPQEIVVPSHMECVGIELHFSEALRKDIQTDVDALAGSPKYFQIKLERARQYFPIIERILKEENVPDDIKYLAMQESALISDAVSSSDAVGFWQFKIASASEVGIRINQDVDERMNIVAATRGAAKYLKANNFFYNNWIYSVLSYNTGRGGAEKYVDHKYLGVKRMELGKETYWYIRKFIAHKIVFENKLREIGRPSITLSEYTKGGGKSLSQIAKEFNIEPDDLTLYNKWLKSKWVPEDKNYIVIIPGTQRIREVASTPVVEKQEDQPDPSPNMSEYPIIKETKDDNSRLIKVNGIPGIISIEGDTFQKLAILGSIPLNKFLTINDIDISNRIVTSQVYYFKNKHNKSREYFHTVVPGQNLWDISQKYGIKRKKILSKNRIINDNDIKPGMVLWIRYIRPMKETVKYAPIPKVEQKKLAEKPVEDKRKNQIEIPKITPPSKDTIIVNSQSLINIKHSDSSAIVEPEPKIGIDTVKHNDSNLDSINQIMPLFHVVQAGETLYGISKKYNVSIDSLIRINDLQADAGIKIGQQLYLKRPPSDIETNLKSINNSSESYTLYEVLMGDTMYSIARKFNVSVQNIQDWNKKDSFQLSVGEFLKIFKP